MLASFTKEHQLPVEFLNTANKYYVPIAELIFDKFKQSGAPYFVGVNGCQGSGKSTLTQFIGEYLIKEHQVNVAVLSLDDFYLSSQQRHALANSVHPLFKSRGVPGTHNTELLKETLSNLQLRKTGFSVPRFDKSTDEPCAKKDWTGIQAPIDIILFEGWCWGTMPQTTEQLKEPINDFEEQLDSEKIWRTYANQQLALHYQPLYQIMNYWVVLQAPSFDCVYQWRLEQEQKLAKNTLHISNTSIMSSSQIHHFIQYFQRLTEHAFSTLSKSANITLLLNTSRHIKRCKSQDLTLHE